MDITRGTIFKPKHRITLRRIKYDTFVYDQFDEMSEFVIIDEEEYDVTLTNDNKEYRVAKSSFSQTFDLVVKPSKEVELRLYIECSYVSDTIVDYSIYINHYKVDAFTIDRNRFEIIHYMDHSIRGVLEISHSYDDYIRVINTYGIGGEK